MIFNRKVIFVLIFLTSLTGAARAQSSNAGPNVKAYLDYLKTELVVTDARESQREVSQTYFRLNFNRVSALRKFALKWAQETEVDYIPELEAVVLREFRTLFPENQPKVADLRVGEIYNFSYRYLGNVKNSETFYIFARLDPYEEEAARRPNPSQTENLTRAKIEEPDSAKLESAESAKPEATAPRITREKFLLEHGNKPKHPVQQPNP